MINKIDVVGAKFIQQEEGLRLKAYKCAAGISTVGWGSTYYEDGTKVKMGDVITKERAVALFSNVVKVYELAVAKNVKVPLTQNQFNALVSFCFNVGTGAFIGSTLLKKINLNVGNDEIKIQLARWSKAGGKVNEGLAKRRMREYKLYIS